MQSVAINTKVVSSNPVHGEMYSIQHYVIKFVSNLLQVDGFLHRGSQLYFHITACGFLRPGHSVSSTKKTDRHKITKILLKVALNTINHQQPNSVNLGYHSSYCFDWQDWRPIIVLWSNLCLDTCLELLCNKHTEICTWK